MPVNRRALSGLCLSAAHAEPFLTFIDGLEARIDALDSRVVVVEAATLDVFSTLGQVAGGVSEPAGTTEPANVGTVIIVPGALTWIQITGVDCVVGDAVFHTFGGSPISSPTNPANRRCSARVVADGVIELALSGGNPDNEPSSWLVVKKPVT